MKIMEKAKILNRNLIKIKSRIKSAKKLIINGDQN